MVSITVKIGFFAILISSSKQAPNCPRKKNQEQKNQAENHQQRSNKQVERITLFKYISLHCWVEATAPGLMTGVKREMKTWGMHRPVQSRRCYLSFFVSPLRSSVATGCSSETSPLCLGVFLALWYSSFRLNSRITFSCGRHKPSLLSGSLSSSSSTRSVQGSHPGLEEPEPTAALHGSGPPAAWISSAHQDSQKIPSPVSISKDPPDHLITRVVVGHTGKAILTFLINL